MLFLTWFISAAHKLCHYYHNNLSHYHQHSLDLLLEIITEKQFVVIILSNQFPLAVTADVSLSTLKSKSSNYKMSHDMS